jgi:hypothetical protein
MRIVKLKGMRQVNGLHYAPDGLTAAVSGQSGRVVLFDLDG